MNKDITISIYLDTRRAKASGMFPVKLRVFYNPTRTAKLYPTTFELSKQEFQRTWETVKPRKEHQDLRDEMEAVIKKAKAAVKETPVFTFEGFERRLFRKADEKTNVLYYYEQSIQRLRRNEQLSTASNYALSRRSLIEFIKATKGKEPRNLPFEIINGAWLNEYEAYMVRTLGKSYTTVSMYLRALRTIFNDAIKAKDIPQEIYPFTKDSYKVPGVKKVRKALNNEQLKTLFESEPKTPEQVKAKDFWFFSYICNGMNIKDIAQLRHENLKDKKLIFVRAKTERTTKGELKSVIVYLTDYANEIIAKYAGTEKDEKDYIFPILEKGDSAETKRKKVQNFTRSINQNFKKFALDLGIQEEISTYWARHSFATQAIRQGASMEFVSEALNHSNVQTTQGYFAGFADETKRELAEKLLIF